jgi:hypothetical protein
MFRHHLRALVDTVRVSPVPHKIRVEWVHLLFTKMQTTATSAFSFRRASTTIQFNVQYFPALPPVRASRRLGETPGLEVLATRASSFLLSSEAPLEACTPGWEQVARLALEPARSSDMFRASIARSCEAVKSLL